MRILIVTPAPRGSRKGNRITAERWAAILRSLRAKVEIAEEFQAQRADMLLALHARKSARSVARFAERFPERPIILALTGTDLYQDLQRSALAQRSLKLSTRLVVLQPEAVKALPQLWRSKARVIVQSANGLRRPPLPLSNSFEVCVMGHLRTVKDPFRAAMAARRLPPASRLRVIHMGEALSKQMQERAQAEMRRNPRYIWLGPLPRWKALWRLARSRLLVLSSRLEGGANVVSEALAAGTPILASRIAGSIGVLGEDYPGYFSVGDTRALAALMYRCETDRTFYRLLEAHCQRLAKLVTPARERQSWRDLLRELQPVSSDTEARDA